MANAAARSNRRRIDLSYLRRCLDLASRAEGRTSPNPMVGAVLVKSGRLVGEAFHRKAGSPHAEATVLRRAGKAARGATLYVNLEPCSHQGRTPPCVQAILAARVRRVVICHRDPFYRVRGRGVRALRAAGVAVDQGLLREEALRLNERYLTYVERQRPFVLVKAAMTLDGRIATSAGASRWISSAASRRAAHRLRATYDAVMVGARTAVRDDPLLTARHTSVPPRQPVRVILDSRLGIDPNSRLLRNRTGGQVIIYCVSPPPRSKRRKLTARGALVVAVGRTGKRGVDLSEVLKDLARREITSVMIEGGGELIWSALEAGVVDRVVLFVAPLIVGGRSATPVVGGDGAATPGRGFRLSGMTVTRSGPDLLVEGRVKRPRT